MEKNHHQQNKFVKEKRIASELLINAAYPRIRGIHASLANFREHTRDFEDAGIIPDFI